MWSTVNCNRISFVGHSSSNSSDQCLTPCNHWTMLTKSATAMLSFSQQQLPEREWYWPFLCHCCCLWQWQCQWIGSDWWLSLLGRKSEINVGWCHLSLSFSPSSLSFLFLWCLLGGTMTANTTTTKQVVVIWGHWAQCCWGQEWRLHDANSVGWGEGPRNVHPTRHRTMMIDRTKFCGCRDSIETFMSN